MTEKRDFFISYNSADKAWAEWIAWHLEAVGYETMIQAWDFQPGSNFVLDMHRASSNCERTIAVLSPDYLNALYTQPSGLLLLARIQQAPEELCFLFEYGSVSLRGFLPRSYILISLG